MADLPHGGQILLDATTFRGVHNNLNVLGAHVTQVRVHHTCVEWYICMRYNVVVWCLKGRTGRD